MPNDDKREGILGILALLFLILGGIIFFYVFNREKRKNIEESYNYLLDERDRFIEELSRLSALRNTGAISEEEYEKRRKAILDKVWRIEQKLSELEAKGRAS